MTAHDREPTLPLLPPSLQDRLFAVLFGDPARLKPLVREALRRL